MQGAAAGTGIGTRSPAPELQGDLEIFRGYDLVQLLGIAGASGNLRLWCWGVRGEIHVQDGQVIGARSRPNPRRLGRILRSREMVGERAVDDALRAQIDGHRARLGEILLARGHLDGPALECALVEQAEAALAALMILPRGRFTFRREPLPVLPCRLQVDPHGLVLEALARFDELQGGARSA